MRTEFIELGDIRMAYCRHGNGETLLFLHGNSGSKAFFKAYQRNYFSNYQTLALDSRGHGQSRSRDEVLSYEQQSNDVIKFCKAQGISQASVVGYSDGGIIGLWLAIKAPEVFTRVVAISPNTLASGSTEDFTRTIHKMVKVFEKLKRLGRVFKKMNMRFRLMLTDSGITEDDLKKIKTKVMIVYAERDLIKEEHILHIAGLIPGCKLVNINDCTHLTVPQQPGTIEAIKDYLQNN